MFRLNRFYTVLFHIGIWSVLFLSFWLWRPWQQQPTAHPQLTGQEMLLAAIPFILLFYWHAYWLIPEYLTRRKRLVYLSGVLAGLAVTILVPALMAYWNGPLPAGTHLITFRRALPGLFFLMASASLGISRQNAKLEKARKEKENEHLRTELSFLRTQVNPHFMLNVLNSMVLLARKKSDLLEPGLMELARLMNYMLYDANNAMISLEDEIDYLRAYIDLQMLRFGGDVNVTFKVPESTNGSCIEPMLLIPLVENAFKHGIGLVTAPVIFIDICTDEDHRMHMTVKNKYNPLIRQQENRPSGIGLTNLSKRLELIYPGSFELIRTDSLRVGSLEAESWFIITLNIPLQ